MTSNTGGEKGFQPRVVLECQPRISHPFQDQILNLGKPVIIGRTPTTQQQRSSMKLVSASGSSSPNGNGVSNENSCRFDSRVLSKYHAIIYYENNTVWIRDTNSTNGTFVNGKQLSKSGTPTQLSFGDSIQFGITVRTKKQSSIACSDAGIVAAEQQPESLDKDSDDDWTEERAVYATLKICQQSTEEIDTKVETSFSIDETPITESLLTESDSVALKGIVTNLHEATRREQCIGAKMAAISKVVKFARASISIAGSSEAKLNELESRLIHTQEQLAITTMVLGINGSSAVKDAAILDLLDQKQNYQKVAQQRLAKATQERLKFIKLIHSQEEDHQDIAQELDTRNELLQETEKKMEVLTKNLEASNQKVASLQRELAESMKRRNDQDGGTTRQANQNEPEPEVAKANGTPFNLLDAENNLGDLIHYFEHQSGLNADGNQYSDLILSLVNVLTAVRVETRKGQDREAIRIPFGAGDRREVELFERPNSKAENENVAVLQAEEGIIKKEKNDVDNVAENEVNPSTSEAQAETQIQLLQTHNQALQARLSQLSNFFEASCTSLENYKQRSELLETTVQEQEQQMMELRTQLKEAHDQLAGTESLIQTLRVEVTEMEKTANDLAMLNRRLEGDIQKLRTSLHAKGTEMEEVKLELHVLRQGAEEMLEWKRRTTYLDTLDRGLRIGQEGIWMKELGFIVTVSIILVYVIAQYLSI